VFHERVIVGESERGRRFFAAVAVPCTRERGRWPASEAGRDVHPLRRKRPAAAGRSIASGARRPRPRGSPTSTYLNNEHPLDKLVNAAGGIGPRWRPPWNSVRAAIDSIKPQLATSDVRRDIEAILAGVTATCSRRTRRSVSKTFWAPNLAVGASQEVR
jgi:hypothetical protein